MMTENLCLENLTKTTHACKRSKSCKDRSLKSITMVILGQKGTGKTTIFRKMHEYFKTKYPDTTRVNDRLEINNDRARVTVLDINLPAILDDVCLYTVCSKGDVFVLVYSTDDEASFEYISQIKDFLVRPRNRGPPTITVVGNKSDLHVRAMRYEVADCIVSIDWELNYLEMSAMYDDPEDAIPKILRWLVPRIKKAPLLPVGDEFDTFELRGIQFRRSSSVVCKAKSKPRETRVQEDITEEVLLPIQGNLRRRRFSLPNNLFIRGGSRTKRSNEVEQVQSTRRPSLISQLLLCVKDKNATDGM